VGAAHAAAPLHGASARVIDVAVSEAVAQPPTSPAKRPARWLALPIVLFALVSLTAGFLASRDPSAGSYFDLFFSDPIHMKAWLASVAAALALFQLFTAAWIFRRLPWSKPAWVNPAHRWSGRLAFIATLPVAYHCIFKLGYQDATDRVMWHSLLGCAFFGAYAAKVTIVRLKRFPGPTLPIAGGLLFAVLIGVWWTSARWFFGEVGVGL
jgi:Family of unknown function (DUF6529)